MEPGVVYVPREGADVDSGGFGEGGGAEGSDDSKATKRESEKLGECGGLEKSGGGTDTSCRYPVRQVHHERSRQCDRKKTQSHGVTNLLVDRRAMEITTDTSNHASESRARCFRTTCSNSELVHQTLK